MKREPVFLVGSGNPYLGDAVLEHLGEKPVKNVEKMVFPNGEISCKLLKNVRDKDVYIIQGLEDPVNETLMELLVMADAAKRGSARSITAVLPHFAYARQDRKAESRTPITAKLVADMIAVSGITGVISVDIHSLQTQGFFNIPCDNVPGVHLTADAMVDRLLEEGVTNLMIVSPDAGGLKRAELFADKMKAELAVIQKDRGADGSAKALRVIGDVTGKNCLIVDDMIDTAGTAMEAVRSLKANGAKSVRALMTHGLFSGTAYAKIGECEELDRLYVTNTLEHYKRMPLLAGKLKTIDIAQGLAHVIGAHINGQSINSLF